MCYLVPEATRSYAGADVTHRAPGNRKLPFETIKPRAEYDTTREQVRANVLSRAAVGEFPYQ